MYEIFERLCTERGVTAYRVCKETGLKTGSISNWKSGKYQLKQDKLQKIAEYFGVSVDYLMGRGDGSSGSAEAAAPAELTEDETELLRLFRLLNSDGRAQALEQVENLAQLPKYTNKNKESCFSGAI